MILTDIYTNKHYEISEHALEQSEWRGVGVEEILMTIRNPHGQWWNDTNSTWNYVRQLSSDLSVLVAVNEDVIPCVIVTVIVRGE